VTAVLALGVFFVLLAAGGSWAAAPLLPPRPAATANGEPGNAGAEGSPNAAPGKAGARAGNAGLRADNSGPSDVLIGFTIYS
jgi:hypothetical protein